MIPLRDEHIFNKVAVKKPKKILAGSIPGRFDSFFVQANYGKMVGQGVTIGLTQIGYDVEGIRLSQIVIHSSTRRSNIEVCRKY